MSAVPSKSLAKVAFAVSLLGVCFFPICAIGGVLAVIDAIRHWGQMKAPGFDFRGWAFGLQGVSLMFSLCMIPSMPMVFANQQHLKQRECREGLRAVMTRFTELRDGGVPMSELVAAVPSDRRHPYTYVLGEGVTVPPTKNAPSAEERARQLAKVRSLVQPGMLGECPACQLTIACVGNTDDDDELDLLSVSTETRYVFDKIPVDAQEIYLQSTDYPFDSEKKLIPSPRGGEGRGEGKPTTE